MPSKKTVPKAAKPTVLPVVASTSTPTPVSESSTSSTASTTTASPAATLPTAPPDVTIPAPPTGFVPVNLKDYRGSFPKAGQIAALPGAIIELQSNSSFETVFGPGVPPASQLVGNFTIAARWTALRVAIEAFLLYVRSNEAITWKSSFADLEKLDAIFQVLANQNPTVLNGFPELGKLLDVPKAIAKRAAATRARNAKAKRTAETPAAAPATGATAPVVTTGGAGSAGGGAAH